VVNTGRRFDLHMFSRSGSDAIRNYSIHRRQFRVRPGRSQHNALDALTVAITSRKVNWILHADMEGFFDAINHEWLIKFLERRIGDPRILRLIRKWLRAGVSEDGEWSLITVSTPQGAVISPFFANVYLHYVFDLWIQWWRKSCRSDVVLVRYADDFVIGFENHSEATACLEALHTCFARFGLKLHKDKTRLIEFGKYAIARRERHSESRPETFNFPTFTHKCAQTKEHGRFTIHRHSIAKRVRATLQTIKEQLRNRMHRPTGETGRWFRRVVQGWQNCHAIPSNSHCLCRFVDEITRLWLAVIRRRSQSGRSTWTSARM
jgi:group II intron reverse transcriptase/maturase